LADKDKDGGYEEEDFENLIFRYEEPNGMTRWDSPLFIVVQEDVAAWCDQVWDALVGSDGKAKVVRPHQATVLVRTWQPFGSLAADSRRNLPPSRTTSTSSTRPPPTLSPRSRPTRKIT